MNWEVKTLYATVSVGLLSQGGYKETDLTEMLAKADAVIYGAKRGGRNNIVEIRESSAV